MPTERDTQNIDVSTLYLLRKYTFRHYKHNTCVGADLQSVPCIPHAEGKQFLIPNFKFLIPRRENIPNS